MISDNFKYWLSDLAECLETFAYKRVQGYLEYQELIKRSNGNPCLTAGKDLKRFRDWSKKPGPKKAALIIKGRNRWYDSSRPRDIYGISTRRLRLCS